MADGHARMCTVHKINSHFTQIQIVMHDTHYPGNVMVNEMNDDSHTMQHLSDSWPPERLKSFRPQTILLCNANLFRQNCGHLFLFGLSNEASTMSTIGIL